ncbi:MAG: hypothetical protein IJV03_04010 [Alphaproteobacteria bacterium]|nr:hypothetical protein [Alphaproteobacteria bacterium]
MKKIALLFTVFPISAFAASEAEIALTTALSHARENCSGVSAKMENIKKMAGIGTAVNAVGTAAGVGGVASGVIKQKTDVEMAGTMGEKAGIDLIIEKLKQKQLSPENQNLLKQGVSISPDLEKNLEKLAAEMSESGMEEKINDLEKKSDELQNKINQQQKKSDTAGNVRTGMFAVDTVSNVAGAVVSSKTIVNDDFVEQIKKCTESVAELRDARVRAKVEDGGMGLTQNMDISQKIIEKCGEYEYVNLTPLKNLGKGAVAANSIGSVTGVTATITSALGNSKHLSDMDFRTKQGLSDVKKYESMNTASNVLGGVTTAASLTGTVLNAIQIKEAKKILDISSECEGALQW